MKRQLGVFTDTKRRGLRAKGATSGNTRVRQEAEGISEKCGRES